MSRTRSTVIDVLDHYGIEYKESTYANSEISYYCPFHTHSDQELGSSSFNEEDEIFFCFACGEGGSLYNFVMRMEKCSYVQAKALIDSNFCDTQVYDIDNLKLLLERQQIRCSKPNDKYLKSIVIKFLENLAISKGNLSLFNKWYAVIVYITNSHLLKRKLSQNEIINLYSAFLTDIQNINQKGVL